MKINDKHKYDIDIIEIKIFLDEMSKNRFDQNFINTYNLIINNSIDSLGLTFEKIKDVVICLKKIKKLLKALFHLLLT